MRARLFFALALAGCGVEPAASVAELRPTDVTSAEMWRFAPGEVVEQHDSAGGLVRVFYTRDGTNAVPPADADGSGVPDAVETVAATYDEALAFYASRGFRMPVSDLGTSGGDGGDGRFDVYLVDFALRADGSYRRERCSGSICSGYMVQENDFTGYRYPSFEEGTRILASHELFHAVQAAYDADTGANFSEATAVWATEEFDPSLDDYEGFLPAWVATPERSLDQEPLAPADGYSYGLAIFFRYLTERHGPEVVREIWEAMVDGAGGVADPSWLPTTEAVLRAHGVARLADAYHELVGWLLYAGLGGPPGSTFADARRYPPLAADAVTLPFADPTLRVFTTSMRTWRFAPEGRTQLAIALTGDAAALEPLAIFVGVRRTSVMEVRRLDALDGSVNVDVSGATEITVAVANGAIEGSSARPGICIGSPAEVRACLGGGDAGLPDAGASDAGPTGDVGTGPAGGCACRAGAGRPTTLPALALLPLALLARRRR